MIPTAPHITRSAPNSAPGTGRTPVYAVVGNPNCGKSTLFNALTGLKQKVGNYPGVTVEKKVGTAYSQHGQPITVIDLPGAYSLAARSPDEAVTRDVLLGRRADTQQPDRILCVVDATNLERNLYLVHQILDLGRPVILALNMMDLAAESGLDIRVARLEHELGIPVIPCEAVNGKGVIELKLAMSRADLPLSKHAWTIPAAIAPAVSELQASLVTHDGKAPLIARAEALLLLTDQDSVRVAGSTPLHPKTQELLHSWEKRWQHEGTDWAAALVNSRYDAIGVIAEKVVLRSHATNGLTTSDRIDAWVTHPVWGWLILGTIMALLFLSIFTLAEYPMNWLDGEVSALSEWVKTSMAPGDLRDLITDGAIAGVGGVVMFLPQILILFFFIGLLESTGYMSRAAFIMDRLMSRVGLNGKSFIPLLSSYACAIPGIMATRTIEQPKDRLVTMLVSPLMSCSARLPVYLLLIAALVPDDRVPLLTKVGLMLLMYSLGTFGAFGFAWLFKRTLLKGEPPVMIMELPPYHAPRMKDVMQHMVERAWVFLRRAGTIILGISIVLWFLTAYPKAPTGTPAAQQIEHSFAGQAGRVLEPVIKPLGFDWRIGIGLVTSFAAREVFVSSTAVVFNVEDFNDQDVAPLRTALREAKWPDGRALFTPLVCLTLMIYYVFAMQCVSTLAVVKRESNSWRWPLFQLGYMTGTAWILCFIVYQTGRALGF
ncbi:ferrous iron transport protein B [Opitutus sp. ER46]|uniref:ferrous iron transport protein B n=1 Tax=Opitutus sp. ER46 TaxID=2161864 RepID=UPI000D31A692|nr:ferrous iron transport protein B [Opitutus sp. ER46]PTX98471.1 ferrous iron transport protein B [Opitutus sp. ER46]